VPELVAIDLPAGPVWPAALQSVWDRGDAALPLDSRLSARAKAALVDGLRATRIISADGETRRTGGLPVDDGDALVIATSGTTGEAKGVVLTHQAVLASAQATSTRLAVEPDRHRWLACLPLGHVGGLSVVTRSLLTGTPMTVLPRFDVDAVVAAAGPDVLVSLVPTALRRVGAGWFRTVVLGGSTPPPALPPNVVTTYGLTETGSGVVYDGVPLPGVDVAVDPATSEIRVRGPMLLRAYRDGAAGVDAEGWLATGDGGHFDANGKLHVHGRLKEMIISGGDNIWPAAVEAALRTHPGVSDVAVAGRPHPEWGQQVVAWVIPTAQSAPPTLDQLRAVVSELVAPFAGPRRLILVESLPRTPIGKVQRDALPEG
jgi:o-succinylbenzoate---CoA ligase